MTIEERLNRIEHFSASADEQRKDRETDRALWRDTQRQLNDLTGKLADLSDNLANLSDRVKEIAEVSRAADRRLGERIESMISAMGGYIREHPPTA